MVTCPICNKQVPSQDTVCTVCEDSTNQVEGLKEDQDLQGDLDQSLEGGEGKPA